MIRNIPTTQVSAMRLNVLTGQLVHAWSGREVDIDAPMSVVSILDAALYVCDNEHLLDYGPETLGYYWIQEDRCLRTNDGLEFKEALDKERGIQVVMDESGSVLHQEIDWERSVRPQNKKEYRLEREPRMPVVLYGSKGGEWYLEADGIKWVILMSEMEFYCEYTCKSIFDQGENGITSHGERLTPIDPNTFRVLNCHYATDENSAFFGSAKIDQADIPTFEVLTMGLAKDKNNVYASSRVLNHADPESLELIGDDPESSFFKDNERVFHGDSVILGADPETFSVVNHYFGVDKKYVYCWGRCLRHVDLPTFCVINETYFKDGKYVYKCLSEDEPVCESDVSFKDLGHSYFKLKGRVYYRNQANTISHDDACFKRVSGGWARDSSVIFFNGEELLPHCNSELVAIGDYAIVGEQVFYRYGEVEGADSRSFRSSQLDFALDKDSLYYMGEKLNNSFPDSFEQMDTYIFRDKRSVYLVDRSYGMLDRIENVDALGMILLGDGYMKNDVSVYSYGKQMMGVDAASFELMQDGYARDKNCMYAQSIKLEDLDVATVHILSHKFVCDYKSVFCLGVILDLDASQCVLMNDDFIKDGEKVYFNEVLVEGADAQSFEIVNKWYQTDNNKVFSSTVLLDLNKKELHIVDAYAWDAESVCVRGCMILGADPISFEILGCGFSKDTSHVYYGNEALDNVDVASFRVLGYVDFQDKNNTYTFKEGQFVVDRVRIS